MTVYRWHAGHRRGPACRVPPATPALCAAAAARTDPDAVFGKHRLAEGDSGAAHAGLDLEDLQVDQHPIPEGLHDTEGEPCPAIEETEPDDVAIEEIRDRAQRWRDPRVHVMFEEAPEAIAGVEARLAGRRAGRSFLPRQKQVDRLPGRISIVLVDPPSDAVQVLVEELRGNPRAASGPQHDVLVHPAVFAATDSRAKHP